MTLECRRARWPGFAWIVNAIVSSSASWKERAPLPRPDSVEHAGAGGGWGKNPLAVGGL